MKRADAKSLHLLKKGSKAEIKGWIKARRKHKGIIFLDISDPKGEIQAVLKQGVTKGYEKAALAPVESAVIISGKISIDPSGKNAIEADKAEVVSAAKLNITPTPRSDFEIFDSKYVDHTLKNRHLYLRNPKVMAIMKIRHNFFKVLREWFNENKLVEITAPVLTQIPLYEENTAFKIDFFKKPVFLTQCVAFYLEAAVHAFERVYNIGPSFRAEESSGKRHLAEYWHVKTELAWTEFEEMIKFTESMVHDVVTRLEKESKDELKTLGVKIDLSKIKPPFPRITYDEALKRVKKKGMKLEWGKSLGADEERVLSEEFKTPFWVSGIPCKIEPFPYEQQPANPKVTMVADLLLPEGYGELLGVAQKISDKEMLMKRMKDKGLIKKYARYKWYVELRDYGCVAHCGFGMGAERFLRWFTKAGHVRDAIPFPRLFKRIPYP